MFRLLTVLFITVLLSACSKAVTEAQLTLEDSLTISKELEFRRMKTYPGGVVCGEYSAYVTHHMPKADFQRFLTVRGKLYKPPHELEWEFFCNKQPAQVLLNATGIGTYDANNAELAKISADISSLDIALEAYYANHYFYPSMEQELQALVTAPEDLRRPSMYPQGGYLTSVPSDPWGRAYLYHEEQWGRTKGHFTLTTLGADGVVGGEGKNADVGSDVLQYLRHIAFILAQQ